MELRKLSTIVMAKQILRRQHAIVVVQKDISNYYLGFGISQVHQLLVYFVILG